MRAHADDGFGNLVPVSNPYGAVTAVYARIDGRTVRYEAGTADPVQAIAAARKTMVADNADFRISHNRWKHGPVLAVVKAGKPPSPSRSL